MRECVEQAHLNMNNFTQLLNSIFTESEHPYTSSRVIGDSFDCTPPLNLEVKALTEGCQPRPRTLPSW
jgi:hypothetical protein